MADLKYSFLDNDFFGVYQNTEPPKVELNLPLSNSSIDISDWASGVTSNGVPIVKSNNPESYMTVNNSPHRLGEVIQGEDTSYNQLETFKVTPKKSSGETKKNAEKVISTLMEDLNLTRAQAAGIAGVMTFESGLNPGSFNKKEKAGTYKTSGANNLGKEYGHKNSPWSYGAGICQWTFIDRKEKAIMGGLKVSLQEAKKIITHGGIESLSLDQQIKMLEYELTNSYKEVLEGIRKCNTASEAAATFHCHAISGHSKSVEKATLKEIDDVTKRHYKIGIKIPILNQSMGYAEGYML